MLMGWLNKRQDLKILLKSFSESPDVFAITEFKPKRISHQLLISEFNSDGYNIFCHDLNNNNGRGVLFQVSILDNPSAFQECLLLMISGKTTRKVSQQLLIGIIYPNSSQENDKELYKLFQYIQLNYNVPKLMVGDFNYSISDGTKTTNLAQVLHVRIYQKMN